MSDNEMWGLREGNGDKIKMPPTNAALDKTRTMAAIYTGVLVYQIWPYQPPVTTADVAAVGIAFVLWALSMRDRP